MKDEYSRNPSPKLLKDIQEAKKHIPQLQGQLFRATSATQVKKKKNNQAATSVYLQSEQASPGSDLPATSHRSLYNFVWDGPRQTLILILSKD